MYKYRKLKILQLILRLEKEPCGFENCSCCLHCSSILRCYQSWRNGFTLNCIREGQKRRWCSKAAKTIARLLGESEVFKIKRRN